MDIFSHSFMTEGTKLMLTIAGKADNMTLVTAPYFLLEQMSRFSKVWNGLRAAYEAKGFNCVVENK